jgi:chromosome partitioning protein
MPTIVIANQKGGVGKSTLSCLFAWWLAEHGCPRVLVIDLDAQGNASRSLAAHRCGHSSLALFSEEPMAIGPRPAGLTLLAAEPGLAEIDSVPTAPAVFRRQLARISGEFDAVVIDTPPVLGRRMVASLVAAEFVACPIELEEYSIDGVASMLRTIYGVRTRWNPSLQLVGIVANRFNHHSAAQKRALTTLLARYSEFVLPARIATRSAIPEALSLGMPVWRLPKSSAREASAEIDQVFMLMHRRMFPAAAMADTDAKVAADA